MNRPTKNFSLLYVGKEDDAYLASLSKRYFFAPYEEAYNVFHSHRPDIVIYNGNDVAFCSFIKRLSPDTPIVFLGQKDAELLYEAINIGIDKFFTTPYDRKKLLQTIKELETKLFLKRAKEYNTFMLHQYKLAIDSSNIVSKTDINGIITYVNEEFCKISGYSKDELIGKNHNIVRHPDVPKEHYKRFWDTILAKKIWKGTVKNRAKDGSTFYVNTTVIPILDSENNIVEFVAIRYDVTQSVHLQEKLQKKENELEDLNKNLEQMVEQKTKELQELNLTLEERIKKEVEKNRAKDRMMFQQARLAALGEMLGNIAHQWRQPLMELGLILYKMKKNPEQIENIYKKGVALLENMSQTISDFQNFFSPTKKREVFNVQETIKQTISIIEGSLEKLGVRIDIEAGADYMVEGYKSEFSQVILNILSNAKDILQYSNKKMITIKIYTQDFLYIDIYDTGGGIDSKSIDKIFEPYYTTKAKGTGLGLYMSKMIIEKSMDGMLTAHNWEEGALFRIQLPLKESDGV